MIQTLLQLYRYRYRSNTESFCILYNYTAKMKKKRVNWTISKNCIDIINQAVKISGTSISKLIENAIRHTYKNRAEFCREKIRDHQREMMKWKDELNALEETK